MMDRLNYPTELTEEETLEQAKCIILAALWDAESAYRRWAQSEGLEAL